MKPVLSVLLTAVIVAVSFDAGAQRTATSNTANSNGYNTHNIGVLPQSGKQAAVRTAAATASRLIAEAHMDYDGNAYQPADSFVYNYTGTRGGYYDGNAITWEWLYDSIYTWQYTNSAYQIYSKNIEAFDPSNNPITYVYQIWDTFNHSWAPALYLQTNIYDGANNLVTLNTQSWDASYLEWDSGRRNNTYDGAGNLVMAIQTAWNTSSSSWVNDYRHIYTYDGNNNLITDLTGYWISAAWDTDNRVSYTYDIGNNRITELGQEWDGTGWQNNYQLLFSDFAGNGQPGTIITQFWNDSLFANTYKDVYTFNSYNQPLTYRMYDWQAPVGWAVLNTDEYIRYYYETYATGVQKTAAAVADVKVYPVPAKNELSVSVTWGQPQAFTISLMDMAGRTYIRQGIAASTQYNGQISVANVPTGDYLMRITSAAGEIVKRVVIER